VGPTAISHVSSSGNGTVSGLAYKDEDILTYTGGSGWAMLFDGSDVGVGNTDVDAFQLMADGSILMSFEQPINLAGLGVVADADIVKFTPSQLGNTTKGIFSLYFDGSDVGLTTASEDIDAIALDQSGNLVISTLGSFNVPGLKGVDEDLMRFAATNLGSNTSGSWSLLFDGSDVALTNNSEDVSGVWLEPGSGHIYLNTNGNFRVGSNPNLLSGDSDDIFGCVPLSTGANTQCTFFAFFNGDTVGFNKVLDGISLESSSSTASWQGFMRASGDDEQIIVQFEVLPDEPAEIDSEMDEPAQTTEEEAQEEELSRQLFLPLITR
jgi:hypothetical protein